MGWYYARHGQQTGPVEDAEFARLVADGSVTAATLVWQTGMADWKTYGEVHGAAAAAAGDSDSAICAVSGKIRPKSEMLQFEGQWVSAEHRDEFFQRLREGVQPAPALAGQVPGPYGYAGFWWRFLARFIDRLIIGVISLPLGFGIGAFWGVTAARSGNGVGPEAMLVLQVVVQLLTLAISIGYEVFFVRKFDATPGKMAIGLKIYRPDGQKLTAGRVVGRMLAQILNLPTLLIGYMMAGWDDEKRALHDRICDTRVIRTRR